MEYHHIHYCPNNKLFSLEAVLKHFSLTGECKATAVLCRPTAECVEISKEKALKNK